MTMFRAGVGELEAAGVAVAYGTANAGAALTLVAGLVLVPSGSPRTVRPAARVERSQCYLPPVINRAPRFRVT